MSKDIAIVYMIYINPNVDWKKIVRTQLQDVARTKILSSSDLHIVVSNPNKVADVKNFFSQLECAYKNIEYYDENKFEYWAIYYLWNLSQTNFNYKYVTYFHTKGMSYASDLKRNKMERVLTYYNFNMWKECLKIFNDEDRINKIGLFPAIDTESYPASGGWIWFNFWWARMEYVRHLEEPIDTHDRYYYERWLSKIKEGNPLIDCYSLYKNEPLRVFRMEETGQIITFLHRKLRKSQYFSFDFLKM